MPTLGQTIGGAVGQGRGGMDPNVAALLAALQAISGVGKGISDIGAWLLRARENERAEQRFKWDETLQPLNEELLRLRVEDQRAQTKATTEAVDTVTAAEEQVAAGIRTGGQQKLGAGGEVPGGPGAVPLPKEILDKRGKFKVKEATRDILNRLNQSLNETKTRPATLINMARAEYKRQELNALKLSEQGGEFNEEQFHAGNDANFLTAVRQGLANQAEILNFLYEDDKDLLYNEMRSFMKDYIEDPETRLLLTPLLGDAIENTQLRAGLSSDKDFVQNLKATTNAGNLLDTMLVAGMQSDAGKPIPAMYAEVIGNKFADVDITAGTPELLNILKQQFPQQEQQQDLLYWQKQDQSTWDPSAQAAQALDLKLPTKRTTMPPPYLGIEPQPAYRIGGLEASFPTSDEAIRAFKEQVGEEAYYKKAYDTIFQDVTPSERKQIIKYLQTQKP